MTLVYILVSLVVVLILGLGTRNCWRINLLLSLSALAVYTLQPALPVRGLDFWLPTATLALATLSWVLTSSPENRSWRINWPAAFILGITALILSLTRNLGFETFLTASRPPQTVQVIITLVVLTLVVFLLARFSKPGNIILSVSFIIIILVFIILKVNPLAVLISMGLRNLNHQSIELASAFDLRWLGFSYIAFRLLHTIRDRQSGRLPAVSLGEYVIYIIFFPALTAGPIDRIERFVVDLRRPLLLKTYDLTEAGKRLVIGLFKKFIVADMLALIALNGINSWQVRTTGWTWVLLYAYAFQIYFDFSGYTDIAIGLGRFLGIKLPENFSAPYLKSNLTQFWNNWHITLTQWFRAYFFNPVTRALRSANHPLPIPIVIFVTQLTTMVLIGLWHGVTLNYVLWGIWHGFGLFINNRWSEFTRTRFSSLSPRSQKTLNLGGNLLTFHFVAIGWVFFALPDPASSWHIFQKLFGFA